VVSSIYEKDVCLSPKSTEKERLEIHNSVGRDTIPPTARLIDSPSCVKALLHRVFDPLLMFVVNSGFRWNYFYFIQILFTPTGYTLYKQGCYFFYTESEVSKSILDYICNFGLSCGFKLCIKCSNSGVGSFYLDFGICLKVKVLFSTSRDVFLYVMVVVFSTSQI